METKSKIIRGSDIKDFKIKSGELYIKRNSDVIVMASQNKPKDNKFSGIIISGDLSGWTIGHYSVVWDKRDFKVFEGTLEISQY